MNSATQNRSKRLRAIVGAGAAICVVMFYIAPVASAVLVIKPFSSKQSYEELDAAQAQWNSSGTRHYRFDVQLSHPDLDLMNDFCKYTVEVRDEAVTSVIENTCALPPMTVSGLFGWLQKNVTRFEGKCGPNGCMCDGPVGLDASFDPQRGYPVKASIAPMSRHAVQYRDIWQRIGCKPLACTTVGWCCYPRIKDVVVTPLDASIDRGVALQRHRNSTGRWGFGEGCVLPKPLPEMIG
jgi:hypothetical protein